MANPSLQIGNSNWAIKEDNLLGYSTAGTRFVPQPITMTRASAGTRVNSSGLVETVELLGSEEVTDGNFPTPNTEWSSFGLATINENIVNFVDAGSNTYSGITQDINSFSAKQYKVEITVTNWISGDILATFSSNNASFNITGNGTYSVYLTPVSNGDDIGLVRDYSSGADFSYSITNVSVKESTKNNLARVDYDGTASSLLVEPQSTNVIEYSEDFSNSYWAKTNTDVISNAAVSPDGTQNADKLNFTTSSGEIVKGMAFVSGQTYTMSFYAKTESGTLDFNYGNMDYYVISGTATDEWQRFEIIQTLPTTTRFPKINTTEIGSLLLWGFQIEQQSYATSYIPTDGGTVTRVQDQYSKTGISNLINSEEGVLFVEMAAFVKINPSGNITLTDGSGDNRIYIYYLVDNSISVIYNINSTGAAIHNFALADITQQTKIAVKWGDSNVSVWINGNSVLSTATSNFLPNTLNQLDFSKPSGGVPFEGKVKQLQIYKTTDIDLAALTS